MAEPDDDTQRPGNTPESAKPGSESSAGGASGARLRRTAVLETLGTLAIFVLVDHLFLEGDGYHLFAPHPYWLVVVFVATQYGTREGLFAAAFSSIALYVGGIPDQKITQDFQPYEDSGEPEEASGLDYLNEGLD